MTASRQRTTSYFDIFRSKIHITPRYIPTGTTAESMSRNHEPNVRLEIIEYSCHATKGPSNNTHTIHRIVILVNFIYGSYHGQEEFVLWGSDS